MTGEFTAPLWRKSLGQKSDPANDDYGDGYNEQHCEDVVKESSIKVGDHGGIQSQSAGML
jgi:hypothetical protein